MGAQKNHLIEMDARTWTYISWKGAHQYANHYQNTTSPVFLDYTRMGSKVMPLANFHRNCWREDKTHALFVFSILSPFNRCINCTCRHNISPEIYFCTNPTHRRLSKMVGRSVENEIEIRADIKTRALLSRGSTDIYADMYCLC